MIDHGALRMLMATGKVPRKPDLERLDNARSTVRSAPRAAGAVGNNDAIFRDHRSNHQLAKAELVAFGVNGEVPFFRAALTAGLKVTMAQRDRRAATLERHAANDNTKSAALAA